MKTKAQRRTYVTGRQILFPVLAKAHLVLMDITIGDSKDPARPKAVIVSLRDLFPTDA